MHILAHRGCWQHPGEQNTRTALTTALHRGLGIETDIRDLNGTLVISHDMPHTGALPLEALLEDYLKADHPGYLALNIKSDGLALPLKQMLSERGIARYFCFDMSVPDTLTYLQADIPVAARISEYETPGRLTDISPVIWVDGFHTSELDMTQLNAWLSDGKLICLVSPELHGRPPEPLWSGLAALSHHDNIMLCTDFSQRAREYMA
ncbi:TPA: phosphodiesterase [Klebsiella aerogenes]|nr:phosphodiesterase [Klebsiella aerogenes]